MERVRFQRAPSYDKVTVHVQPVREAEAEAEARVFGCLQLLLLPISDFLIDSLKTTSPVTSPMACPVPLIYCRWERTINENVNLELRWCLRPWTKSLLWIFFYKFKHRKSYLISY